MAQVYATAATVRFTWQRADGKGHTLFIEEAVEGRHTFELYRVAANKEYVIKAFAVLPDGATELIHEWVQAAPSFTGPLADSDSDFATVTGSPTFELLATDQSGEPGSQHHAQCAAHSA